MVDVESWCVCVSEPSRVDNGHTFWDGGREVPVFISFLFTGVNPVRVLDPVRVLGHGPVLGVVVWMDLDWTFGWTCGAPTVALPHLRRLW